MNGYNERTESSLRAVEMLKRFRPHKQREKELAVNLRCEYRQLLYVCVCASLCCVDRIANNIIHPMLIHHSHMARIHSNTNKATLAQRRTLSLALRMLHFVCITSLSLEEHVPMADIREED